MKNIVALLITIFTIVYSYSQKNDITNCIEKGDSLFYSYLNFDENPNFTINDEQTKGIKKLLKLYNKCLEGNNNKDETPLMLYQKIGILHYLIKNNEKAIVFLKKVFRQASNPYSKQFVSKILMNIYLQKNEFDQALGYANSSFKYTQYSPCGNAMAEDRLFKAFTYGKIYFGLKKYNKALDFLLPEIFSNGLVDNRKLAVLTVDVLYKKYKKKEIKSLFAKSLDDIFVIKKDAKDYYYTKILNVVIPIPDYKRLVEKDNGKFGLLIKELKKSEIFKLIESN